MKTKKLFPILTVIFFCFFHSLYSFVQTEEKYFVILITSYNNSEWYKWNLDSVFTQDYPNFRVIYVDDKSPDKTGDLVEQYIIENGWQDRVTLIKNEERKLKMENFYNAVHDLCEDHEIILDLDGDDAYPHESVLSILNEAYQGPEVWMTYGSYVMWPEPNYCICEDFPKWVVERNAYRLYKWVASQQRSFYAWLFKRIDKSDLMCDGKFVDTTADLAYMFPMLEMSGGRFKFIRDVIYLYNRSTPDNDDKKRIFRQLFLDGYLRGKASYKRLEKADLFNEKESAFLDIFDNDF